MIAERRTFRVGTYNNGQPYSVPRGRYAPHGQIEDRLSVDEVMRLLQAAPSLRDKLLLGLFATGVRVSEVVRLRWRDVDFDRRCINV